MPLMIIKAAIIKDGTIYTGKRHGDIFPQFPLGFLRCGEQGFVTDKGKFVNRGQAAKIAYECGQIPIKKSELFSEDLY